MKKAVETIRGVDLADLYDWDVVLAEDAIPSERYAAEEFRDFYRAAGGVSLALTPGPRPGRRPIFIGPGAAGAGDFSAYGAEEFRIIADADRIVIAGGRPRGTLYGVYAFLEDYLGVRFLAGDCTHVPPVGPRRVLEPVDRRHTPRFAFRWAYFYETNNDPVLATRQRVNAVQTDLTTLHRPFMRKPPVAQDGRPFRNDDLKFGGVSPIELVGHTFYLWLPAAEFAASHPEYFAEVDGQRQTRQALDNIMNWQPCLSSPDVLAIVTERVLKALAADPGLKFVNVSQNDGEGYCTCPACKAVDEREGSPMGSLLTFVSRVAESVARVRPDVSIGTLAYAWSRRAPRTLRPHPNVHIQLCSFECCTLHSLDDTACPQNKEFRDNLAAWGRICSRIGVWNYQANFSSYLAPFPALRAVEGTVRYCAANGVTGMFMQGVYDTPAGDMVDLRMYLINALLWDPSRNAHVLMDEFLDLYYGRAAGPIREWIETLHDRVLARNIHNWCYGYNKAFGLDEPLIRTGLRLFAEAERRADNDTVRTRVEKASISVYRAAIDPLIQAKEPIPEEEGRMLAPLAQRFFELCRKHRVLKIRECRVKQWRPVAAEIRQIEGVLDAIQATTGMDFRAAWEGPAGSGIERRTESPRHGNAGHMAV